MVIAIRGSIDRALVVWLIATNVFLRGHPRGYFVREFGLLGLAFISLTVPSAHAAQPQSCQGQTISVGGDKLLCSRTFRASGICDATDRLAMLEASGNAATQLVDPWEPFPITIVGYRIVIIEGTMQYVLAGNSYTPDIMGSLAEAESSHGDFYPPGIGFAFPAAAEASPQIHLDLHYSCKAPALGQRARYWWHRFFGEAEAEQAARPVLKSSFQAFYTIFYKRSNEPSAIADAR
jgi:hypothetical protein